MIWYHKNPTGKLWYERFEKIRKKIKVGKI